jgi:hypothetical protein
MAVLFSDAKPIIKFGCGFALDGFLAIARFLSTTFPSDSFRSSAFTESDPPDATSVEPLDDDFPI